MLALEDVSTFDFSSDDEDDGAVADMNNLDTTIQASPIPTTRIHKERPLDQVIRDLQSATQTRNMKIKEKVYVCQPPGFEDLDFPDRVYKVEKVIYGLHQAPKAWYETLSTYLLDNGFQRGKIDKTLFIKRHKGSGLDWQFDIDALTRTMNYEPIVIGTQSNGFVDVSTFDFSSDDEDDGAVADMNNLDTTIQVSPILTTRIHKDRPLDQVIRDLQSATQTRKMSKHLEEHGIEAIRLFLAYASFEVFLVYQMAVKIAFLYGKIEEEVYVCQPPGFEDLDFPDRVYKVEEVIYGLHQALKAWYETLSTYLLDNGFQRGKIDKTLFIKRHKEVKTASTSMENQKPPLKDEDGEEVDVHMYRYLKGQPKLCLWYPKDSPFNLVAYTNSDDARASLDTESTTRGCQFL
nr:putative ribonuclease H-like domain-containing protein [Tanacetum cinerariifolium]